jgi:hypothetical protein
MKYQEKQIILVKNLLTTQLMKIKKYFQFQTDIIHHRIALVLDRYLNLVVVQVEVL